MAPSYKTASKTLNETVEMIEFVQKLAPKKLLARFEKIDDRAAILFRFITSSSVGLTDDELMQHAAMDSRTYQRAISELKRMLFDAMLDLDLTIGNYSANVQRLFKLDVA